MALGSAGFFSPEGLQEEKRRMQKGSEWLLGRQRKERKKQGEREGRQGGKEGELSSWLLSKGLYSCSRGCGECFWNQWPA